MSDPQERDPRRKTLERAAMIVAGLLGIGAVFLFSGRNDTAPLPGSPFGARPAPPDLPPAPSKPGPQSSLMLPGALEPIGPSFAEFVRALRTQKQAQTDPGSREAADKFQKEFEAQPALKALFNDFKKAADDGRDRPASDFMAGLDKIPEFHSMLDRYLGDPRSAGLYGGLMKAPLLAAILTKVYEAAKTASAAGAKTQGRVADAKSLGARAPIAASAGSNRFSASPGAAGAARGAAASPGGGFASDGEGATRGGVPGGDKPGAEAHDVSTRLEQSWKSDYTSDPVARLLAQYPCLQRLGQDVVKQMVDARDIDNYGLWGACFARHIYGKCRNAGCPGVPETGWQACQDWKGTGPGTVAACLTECQAQAPDCALPVPVVTSFYVNGGARDQSLGFGYATTDALTTNVDVCRQSGTGCTNSAPACESYSPTPWGGPAAYDGSWTPGADGGGCCFTYRIRACLSTSCSDYQSTTACFQ